MFHKTQRERLRSRACAGALCGLVITLAACGGGGGGSSVPSVRPTATPTAAPTATPTPAPVTQSAAVPVSPAAMTAPLPAVGGFAPGISLPSSNAGANASISATTTTTAPAGLATVQGLHRRTESGATPNVYVYEALTSNATIAFNGMPGFTLTLPSNVATAGNDFYIAVLQPGSNQWQLGALGPAQVSGQTLTFAPPAGSNFTLTQDQTLWLAFYSVPAGSGTPTPSPAPTATPTVAPTATPTVAPSSTPTVAPSATPTGAPTATPVPGSVQLSTQSIVLYAKGATAGFVATEDNYSGGFTATSDNTSAATVTAGLSGNFTVTATGAGTANINVADNHGGSNKITVTVTTTGVIIH